MCIRYLGFVLLLWAPGWLRAQSAEQSCSAPSLDGGFFSPKQEVYSHESKLTYTCNDGHKLTVKGWWATTTCNNGKWSHQPQCIDEKDCIPPSIPNGKYSSPEKEWFKDEFLIRVTCDSGYKLKNQAATAKCNNGIWSSLPICERDIHSCGEPPKVPHAVIIHQEYQELFAVDSKVQYNCEDGYTTEEGHITKEIICLSGTWTEVPTCRPSTSSDSGPQMTTIYHCGAPPNVPNGEVVQRYPLFLKYQCNALYKQEGPEIVLCFSNGTWSTLPICKGPSTISDSPSLVTTIDHCGPPPNVPNGAVLQKDRMFVKYQCNSFYKLHGLDTVVCYSNGTWSTPPTCKVAFCVLDTAQHYDFRKTGVEYIKEGESKDFYCVPRDFLARVQCKNGKITLTIPCCHRYYIEEGLC